MTSNKPYFIRATYDWLVDNNVTPYILIDAFAPGVKLPDACHIDDDNCVLFLLIAFTVVVWFGKSLYNLTV